MPPTDPGGQVSLQGMEAGGNRQGLRLAELTNEVDGVEGGGQREAEARDVTHDARQGAPGSVFAAIRGQRFDAHRFIPQAIEGGAVAVISDESYDSPARPASVHVPAWIQVQDARAALARAGAAIHGHPSRKIKLVGITGTNGKTTTAHLIDSIVRTAEGTSEMFGTISYHVVEQTAAAHHTTPESSDIQRMLARALEVGCRSAVMEVSSHAIELHRADALRFAVAVFTNLTRDHLDYH